MTPEQRQLLAKGERNLAVARRLATDGDYDVAVSRAYYAMFYVAKATVVNTGRKFSKHHGVHQAFWEQWIKPGRVAATLHRALTKAFDQRLTSDYEETATFDRTDAERLIAQAEEFLSAVTPLVT